MGARRVLIIYTGGTIGMVKDPKTNSLHPFDFNSLIKYVPGIDTLGIDIESHCFENLIDSSDMGPEGWVEIAKAVEANYKKYDGFVVLHGTDTMAYTASALSFMLEGLHKPVILTGSQLPMGVHRSDGKDNLINAIEMAAELDKDGTAMIKEVAVVFGSNLFRGNRITKYSAESFHAFVSANYPPLAQIGVHTKWNHNAIHKRGLEADNHVFEANTKLEPNILILKIHPGFTPHGLATILRLPGLKGVVLSTYGSGNAPTSPAFTKEIADAIKRGIYIMNVSQCKEGAVEMGKYAASNHLVEAGVIGGGDITTEAAVCKMMHVLGQNYSREENIRLLSESMVGEMTY